MSAPTPSDREKRLDAELKRERQKRREEWEVEDALAIPDYRLVLCLHEGKDGLESFWSAGVRSKTAASGDITHEGLLDLLKTFEERIQPVSFWQEVSSTGAPVTSSVWMPDACNFSRPARHSVKRGEAAVELEANGNARYHARSVSFWIQIPSGRWVELDVQVAHFPRTWEVRPEFKGFSQNDGSCTSMDIEAPRGLPAGYARKGMGSRDAWRFENYWPTVASFRKAFMAANQAR